MEAMEADNDSLLPVLNGLADGDGLKSVLSEALSTVSAEALKFRRGDYNE